MRPAAQTNVPTAAETSHRLLLLTIRLLFVALMIFATLLPFVASIRDDGQDIQVLDHLGPLLVTTAFAVIIVILDIRTPHKPLASVFGIYLGVVAGLLGALAVGTLIDVIAESWDLKSGEAALQYLALLKLVLGISLCYLAVSIVLSTKDSFRLVIPYVEFQKQQRGPRPMALDTSTLIDGRIESFAASGFLDAPIVVPQFVIDELQRLADSSDKLKRERGRRGLNMLRSLQAHPELDISIDAREVQSHSVDKALLELAERAGHRLVTTDFNLFRVAQIRGIPTLNLNDLSSSIQTQAIPGDHLVIEIVRPGEDNEQGVGFLPDGTMVVVEGAAGAIGRSINAEVTNSLQTSAGRMIFARRLEAPPIANLDDPNADASKPQQEPPQQLPPTDIARAATNQPRHTAGPAQDRPAQRKSQGRNPRR